MPHGDCEGPASPTGTVEGWADNSSWADLTVDYRRDTTRPHGGAACQRVRCSRLAYGAVQIIPTVGVPLVKGRLYRVSAWLRGDVGRVAVQLRLAPAPYTIYIERSVLVGPDWRRAEYLWSASADDPNARLMLRFDQEGTLWMDDVAVDEMSPEEMARSAPPPAAGNLLHNGDGDLGAAHWLLNHPCDAWTEAALTTEPGDRGPCLKLAVPEGLSVGLSSDAVSISPGRPVHIGCRLRADKPVAVTLSSRRATVRAQVTGEWQAFQADGTESLGPEPYDHLSLWLQGPATLWLDDAQLRQDGRSSGERPRAVLIADRHPFSLYHDGETPRLHLLTSAPRGGMTVSWGLADFWGKAVRSGSVKLEAGRSDRVVDVGRLPRGWYLARTRWQDQGREWRGETLFCILPPPERKGDVAGSPFGAHFAVDPTSLRLARAVGCRWLRLHPPNHTKWRVVEPRQGEWAWRDEPLRIAREAGLELVGSLDRIPRWASTAPEGTPDYFYTGWSAWLPRDWAEWETYVAATVRRYKPDIHVWEVWNEPNLDDWLIPRPGGTRAAAYLEPLQHTTPVVRREDPTATVIGGVIAGPITERSPARPFTDELLASGGLDMMDMLSFHEYIARSVDEGGEPLPVWLGRLRGQMRALGKELPILNSEGGYANPGTALADRPCPTGFVSPPLMARWLVRQHVAQLACGVRQFFFYNFFIDGSPVVREWEGFVEGDGQPLDAPLPLAARAADRGVDKDRHVAHGPHPGRPRGVGSDGQGRVGAAGWAVEDRRRAGVSSRPQVASAPPPAQRGEAGRGGLQPATPHRPAPTPALPRCAGEGAEALPQSANCT
ncbi:MAG: hypothetical protein HYU66_02300 [Armatimonadetes bacterium]|nr:hypothetical protein [Armatimonadota bacterium]